MRKIIGFLIVVVGIVLITGCTEQTGAGAGTRQAKLKFVCNTYEQEQTEYTLQNEMSALVNSFGVINVNDKGEILEERQELKLDLQVGMPGWSGPISMDVTINNISMTGNYNANSKTGNGKFTADYSLSCSDTWGTSSMERTIDGEFEITPTEYSGHKEKGRLTVQFSGASTHDSVFNLITVDGTREEKAYIEDDDWGGHFIFEELE